MSNNPAIQLYRRVFRNLRVLRAKDKDAFEYYRMWGRGHIRSHDDEDDPERLAFLVNKGEETRKWVCKKYDLETTSPKEKPQPPSS